MDVPGEKLLEPKVNNPYSYAYYIAERGWASCPFSSLIYLIFSISTLQVDMADMLRSLATQKPTGSINLVLYLQIVYDPISVNEDDLAKLEKFRNDFGQDG